MHAMSVTAAGVSFPVLCGRPWALLGLVPRLMSAHVFSAWSGWFGCGVPPGFYGFCRRCWCCGIFLRCRGG